MPVKPFFIRGYEPQLLPERALFFNDLKTLIISDLHLGKINHFRKAGIAVPLAANEANLETLVKLLMQHQPKRLIFIGDLFHSHYNSEWESLGSIFRNFSACSFELVPGNHDIMSLWQYERHQIIVHPPHYNLTREIVLAHEPNQEPDPTKYFISGHVHPAIHLRGKGRHAIILPCFWFGATQGILPAFGVFTGMKPIRPKLGDRVFAIAKGEVLDVSLPAVKNNTD